MVGNQCDTKPMTQKNKKKYKYNNYNIFINGYYIFN